MSACDTATAYEAWQKQWSTVEGRARWIEPEPDVMAVAARWQGAASKTALDLGCGVGRHALYLASQGFTVFGLDGSQRGIDVTREEAQRLGLSLDLRVGPMTHLPYPDAHFDYVLAWNVIYHGDGDIVRQCIADIRRVLRPGGMYHSTMLSKRHQRFGQGREIAPNTFVADDTDDTSDKDHPHFYCNAAEIVTLLPGFDLISLVDREQGGPGTYHWHLLAERL